MATLERNLAIRREHEEGASYNSLGKKYGLSAARIQQICDRVKTKPVYTGKYKITKIQQTMVIIQARVARMTADLTTLAVEVSDLERLLQATLLPRPDATVLGDASDDAVDAQ